MKLDPYIQRPKYMTSTPAIRDPLPPTFPRSESKAMIEPKYLTLNQTEAIYNIGRGKLYELMKLGLVRCVKLRGGTRASGMPDKRTRVLVDVASLEAYLSGLPNYVLPSYADKP
jgi:hypothetical protein